MSKTKMLTDPSIPRLESIADDALVTVTDKTTGKVSTIEFSKLKKSIGNPYLHKFSIPTGTKMAFTLEPYGFLSFTISGSNSGAQASGFLTGYHLATSRWFLNAKRKNDQNIKAYMSDTVANIFVVENLSGGALTVHFVSSKASIVSETYNEATHGTLSEFSWV